MDFRGHIDLPARWERLAPRPLSEAGIAIAAICVAVGLRLLLDRLTPGIVPFALTFPAIAAVVILAGARAGLITLVGCQSLIWYAILPPYRTFAIDSPTTAVNLFLVTLAQLLMLWAISSSRRATQLAHAADMRRIDGLSLALNEIDHRTKNNFQLAIGMLTIQARNSADLTVKAGLDRAAARLQVIASVYKNLALSSADLQAVYLHEHLKDIIEKLREGLLSPAVTLVLVSEQVIVPHQVAIRVGLMVNELVTNAAKHAFPDGVGNITVSLAKDGNVLLLEIRDNGRGLDTSLASDGLGTKLVTMLVRQTGGKITTSSDDGTRHDLRIPLVMDEER